jgi:hypothetical protein
VSINKDGWTRVFERHENIITRQIAGETILVPIRGKLADMEHIFTLNMVGNYIWEHLDGGKNLAELLDSLLDHFEVNREDAERDTLEFIDQIAKTGLASEKS